MLDIIEGMQSTPRYSWKEPVVMEIKTQCFVTDTDNNNDTTDIFDDDWDYYLSDYCGNCVGGGSDYSEIVADYDMFNTMVSDIVDGLFLPYWIIDVNVISGLDYKTKNATKNVKLDIMGASNTHFEIDGSSLETAYNELMCEIDVDYADFYEYYDVLIDYMLQYAIFHTIVYEGVDKEMGYLL